jgi:hypothetical protein
MTEQRAALLRQVQGQRWMLPTDGHAGLKPPGGMALVSCPVARRGHPVASAEPRRSRASDASHRDGMTPVNPYGWLA